MNKTLVTSAIEDTWPDADEGAVLFLGEWCKRYSRKVVWEKLNSSVESYHWDDRKKLQKDYNYLMNLYEELLIELSYKLNEIHNTKHTVLYWRILVGPWLGYFVHILYDRWFMLNQVIDTGEANKCTVLENDESSLIPNDMREFVKILRTDEWNESIYSDLLVNYFKKNIAIVITKRTSNIKKELIEKSNVKSYLKTKIRKVFVNISSWFCEETDCFFISTHFPLLHDLKVQLQLGQIPQIWEYIPAPQVDAVSKKREWCLNNKRYLHSSFELIIREMIPKQLPIAYLEGYSQLTQKVSNLPWPFSPRVIFTSNDYNSYDIFKAWAAEKKEKGSLLLIGQHGGNFGMTPFSLPEDHIINIADRWLSWGWTDDKEEKIIPLWNFTFPTTKINYNKNGGALLVEMAMPRNSYYLYAVPIASQWLDYFEDQKLFIESLPDKLRKQVTVRAKGDFGWDQELRWKCEFPDLLFDNGKSDIDHAINKNRLFISTYNATTYLKSMTMNVPTIIFWNPDHWELNQEAYAYFNQLKSVGIFHESPESAADMMIKIWDDIDGWWLSDKVQKVRKNFCHKYSRLSYNSVEELSETFNDFIKN